MQDGRMFIDDELFRPINTFYFNGSVHFLFNIAIDVHIIRGGHPAKHRIQLIIITHGTGILQLRTSIPGSHAAEVADALLAIAPIAKMQDREVVIDTSNGWTSPQ